MSPSPDREAVIFVDGPNLAKIVHDHFDRAEMSLRHFLAQLKVSEVDWRKRSRAVRTYYYTPKWSEEEDKFYTDDFRDFPDFEVREGFMTGLARTEKAVDVYLAVDMVRSFCTICSAVISTSCKRRRLGTGYTRRLNTH